MGIVEKLKHEVQFGKKFKINEMRVDCRCESLEVSCSVCGC
jgi:hypothetical protein